MKHTMSVRILFSLVFLAFFTSCKEQSSFNSNPTVIDNTGGTNNIGQTCTGQSGTINFTQVSEQNSKLDILFVVDTSGSMHSELQRIASQASNLIGTILNGAAEIDFRIAVMLAHSRSETSGKLWQPDNCNNPAVIVGNENSEINSILQPLQCKLNNVSGQDNSNTHGEAAFVSLTTAITTNAVSIKAQDFLREDAGLAIIFASDENEICNYPSEGPPNTSFEQNTVSSEICNDMAAAQMYARLRAFKGNLPLAIAGLVETNSNSPNYSWGYINGTPVGGTVEFAGIINLAGGSGVYSDIHNTDEQIALDLGAIGTSFNTIIQRQNKFFVEQENVDITEVTVNGAKIPFVYDRNLREVTIEPEDAGFTGDQINIHWCEN